MIPNLNTHQQNVDDPVEEMLKKTGCMELHYEVQECIVETQDWRKCQEQVKRFKVCMDKYQKEREKSYLNK
ncbi:cytochrome c oxidase assembly factor 4 homolog, mitochondrial-like isoform X2 [Bombus vosnesenskii]|uniref:Cytochrome c oxidase assembly factor 4 homolog, mitochondrial-like isoform X2 n=3 Tax=Pyrobombus TaxID=144703 RepID=A0A6J3KV57_9HYME|nr:cytochrome c oxidase assembly factor 4 homolog, mitochondrial isoform X2 [Bombus impatiens]XP_033183797.1 cytochrome c oxidase assembly factor 4 homolog, mitochondrial-like isoform X2 [Bombus vancouverensis nearcticus]XP_033311373.1 cytochrome c oxidase assembly factor 4 homolog, mitochondrial-like isoform X2 [Bombus bifarius]XP_033355749.1 cytochrome c oxidase assembly factor 4 homolog, mitochondrial-like isoform X2 [Bombus vosnesenskii]XP_050481650.1 cytochrome c oxidase assembly factor 4 